jgi:O-antigen ligase
MTLVLASKARAASDTHISLGWLGTGWAVLLMAVAVLYRTYDFPVIPAPLELSRQIGLPIMVAQMAFVVWAIRQGFDAATCWGALSTPVRVTLTVFLASFWISSVFVSEMPLFATALCIGAVVQLLFALALYDRLSALRAIDVTHFSNAMVAGVAVLIALTIWQFNTAPPASALPENRIIWQAAIPGFISVRLFGAVCGAILALVVAAALTEERPIAIRSWRFAAMVFVSAVVFWTGTRAALVGFGGALAIAVVFLSLRPRARRFGQVLVALCIGALLGPLFAPVGDPAFQMFTPDEYQSAESATGGRVSLWILTWHCFLEAPLLGLGSAANRWALAPDIFPHVQPHNVVIQFLINWGLAGALPALALLGYATWQSHRIGRANPVVLPVVVMLDSLLIMSMFDGIMHFARETMMVMMCFAIIFASGKRPTSA